MLQLQSKCKSKNLQQCLDFLSPCLSAAVTVLYSTSLLIETHSGRKPHTIQSFIGIMSYGLPSAALP